MIASPNNIGVDDHVDRSAGDVGGTVILFKREILDEWVTLTDSVIVQTFDFTRIRLSSVGGWSNRADPKRTVDGDLMYRSALEPGRASYARGAQIVRSGMKKEELFDGRRWRMGYGTDESSPTARGGFRGEMAHTESEGSWTKP